MNRNFYSDIKVAMYYLTFGVLWILISDSLLNILVTDAIVNRQIQTIKGWIFVFASAVLIYALIKREQTLREAIEKKSFEYASMYQDLVENIEELICTHDLQGKILYANQASADILGLSPDELIGKNIPDLLEPQYRKLFSSYIKIIQKKGAAKGLLNVRTQKGELRIWKYNNTLRTEGVNEPVVRGMASDITESLSAEQKLRYSAQLLDEVNDAIISTDENFKIISWNKAAERITGFSTTEMLGTIMGQKTQIEYLPPNNGEEVLQSFRNNGWWRGEVLQTTKNGNKINIFSSVRLIKDNRGKPIGAVAVNRDITDIKLAEKEIQQSYEQNKFILETMLDGFLLFNMRGEIVDVNPSYCEMVGYTREELLKMSVSEIDTNFKKNEIIEQIENAHHSGKIRFESTHIHKSGAIIDLDVSITVIQQSSEPLLATFLHDITNYKIAEKTIAEKEKFSSAIANTLPAIIYVYDLETKSNVYTNIGLEEVLGYKVDEIKKMGNELFSIILHPDDLPAIIAHEEKLQHINEDQHLEVIYRAKHRNGEWRTIQGFERPFIRNKDGSLKQKIGVSVDITDRKKAEETLQQNSEFINNVLENSPMAIYINDVENKLLLANKRWEIDSKISREKAIGKPLEQIFPASIAEKYIRDNQFIIKNEKFLEFEEKIDERYFFSIKFPLRDSAGKITSIGGISLDITDAKATEKKLAASEEKFAKAFRASPDALMLSNISTGKIIEANEGIAKISGFSVEEIIGKTTLELGLWLNVEDRMRYVQLLQANGRVQNFEAQFKTASGEIREESITGDTIEINNEKYILSILHDITDRKLAEAQTRYQALMLNNISDAVISTDINGIIKTWNTAAEIMFGHSEAEVVGKLVSNIIQYENPTSPNDVAEAQLKNTGYSKFNAQIKSKSGLHLYTNTTTTVIKDVAGKSIGYLIIHHDITELYKTTNEIKKSHDQLRELIIYVQTAIENERAQISRNIHDDFGQMMTGIKMDVSWLERNTTLSDAQQERLNMINHLVNESIITIRRISSELRPGLLDDLGLYPAIEWLSTEYSRRANLNCELNFTPSEPNIKPEIKTTYYRIFQECMTNIMRHAHATEVDITFTLEGGMLTMTIKDNGVGFSNDKQNFKKSLGLLGMQERAAQWNGTVKITENNQQGTTIITQIPVDVTRETV